MIHNIQLSRNFREKNNFLELAKKNREGSQQNINGLRN